MKKLFLGLACAASVGIFFLGQKTPAQASDLTLENIETVGLSAAEITCVFAPGHICSIFDEGHLVLTMYDACLVVIE